MNEIIRFEPNDEMYAKGRNGYMSSAGVEIINWGAGIAFLNVLKNGQVSESARIVLAIGAIPELVAALGRFTGAVRSSGPRCT